MKKLGMLYEGKAKKIFATDDPSIIIMHYKDDATAFNGIKRASIKNKGVLNQKIMALIYKKLQKEGIPTHYLASLNERDQSCKKVAIIPLEIIVRNVIAGSLASRIGIPEGTKPSNIIYELCYKNEELGDPMINDHHAVAIGAASYEEIDIIYQLTKKINAILVKIFSEVGITLVDVKMEFGKTSDGQIVLADEISPDTCRLWDTETNKKLDIDRFRRDLGSVIEGYDDVYKRLERVL